MNHKLLTYDEQGQARAGLLVDDRVYDLAELAGKPHWSSLMSALQEWNDLDSFCRSTAQKLQREGGGRALADTRLLAPLLYPGAIYCAGANYTDHMAEMARAQGQPPGPTMKDLGDKPWHFMKASRGAVVGPDVTVETPADCKMLDWEIELAVVMGREAKNVTATQALDYVAGYTIANDLSARDQMSRPKQNPASPFYYDWIGQKCFDGACPLGPWIAPASAIDNPHDLAMKLWVNDELMQDSNSSNLIFNVAEQIEALSSRITLYPGDVILTGTPAGVGMGRKRFLQPGDEVHLWIDGIGDLRHRMS